MHAMEKRRPPALDVLTATRFFAALWVVISHYQMDRPVPAWLAPFAGQGQAAVDYFFVLSGFILTYNYARTFRHGVAWSDFREFYRARFARIFPLHALALLAMIPVLLLVDHRDLHGPGHWIAFGVDMGMAQSLLPWTEGLFGWNTPSWSISCEMVFYLALPFLVQFLWRRITNDGSAVKWMLGFWALGSLFGLDVMLAARHYFGGVHVTPDASAWDQWYLYTPYARIPEFAIGCVAGLWHTNASTNPRQDGPYARLFTQAGSRNTLLCLAIAAAIAVSYLPFAGGFVGYVIWLLDHYAFYVPWSVIVVLTLSAGPTFLTGLLTRRWLVYLGEASFALYIFHLPVLHGFRAQLAAGTPGTYSLAACYISGTIALSCLLFHFVESPARSLLRGRRVVAVVAGETAA